MPKFIVRRVYGTNIEGFVCVFKDGVKHRTYFNVSEFTVNDIMQCAGVDTLIGSAMTNTEYKRAK